MSQISRRKALELMSKSVILSALGSIGCTQQPHVRQAKLQANPPIPDTAEHIGIYFTLDDGPSEYTLDILDALGNNKATFFFIGQKLEQPRYFDLACQVLEKGHIIGSHSYTHRRMSSLTVEQAAWEIDMADRAITRVYQEHGKDSPKLFRFPYGDPGYVPEEHRGEQDKEKEIVGLLQQRGYCRAWFTLNTWDWLYDKQEGGLEKITTKCKQTKCGDIVLVHESLPTAKHHIPYFTNGPYEFLLLDQPTQCKTDYFMPWVQKK